MAKNTQLLTIEDFKETPDKEWIERAIGKHTILIDKKLWGANGSSKIFRYDTCWHLVAMAHKEYLYIPHRQSFSDLRDANFSLKFLEELKTSFEAVSRNGSTVKQSRRNKHAMNQHMLCWTLDNTFDCQDDRYVMWKTYGYAHTSVGLKQRLHIL